MPNGDDKNVVRLTLVLQAYRERFSAWPTHLRVGRNIWEQGIARYLTTDAMEALQTKLSVATVLEDDAMIRAVGLSGSFDYRDFEHTDLSRVPPLSDWLGDAWRNPIEPGAAH